VSSDALSVLADELGVSRGSSGWRSEPYEIKGAEGEGCEGGGELGIVANTHALGCLAAPSF